MSRYSTLVFISLLLGLGALSACSKSETFYLLVDVSLDPSLPQMPDSVNLIAKQNDNLLKQATLPWDLDKTGILEVGFPLPNDTTIPVVVSGIAYRKGASDSVGFGSATLSQIIKGKNNDPIALVIKSISAPIRDGGVPDSAGDATSGSDTSSDDLLAADGPGGSDGAGADIPATGGADGAISDAPVTAGSDSGPAADAVPDEERVDSALDTPTTNRDAPLANVFDASSADGSVTDGPPDGATDGAGRQWSTPLNVQNHAGGGYPTPSVAVSPATGDAVVVWIDGGNGVQAVHYAAAGNAWGTSPATLESRGTPLSVQVAVDGSGRYAVVWEQNDQTQSPSILGVWASYSSDGVTWSNPPVLLAAGPSNADYGDVRLAVNRAGQGWVGCDQTIRSSMSSSDPEWVYAAYLDGTTAKAPVIVKTGTTNGSSRNRQPRVAIDGKGNGLVVWTEIDPNPAVRNDSTWAAALADGTTPAPQLIESYDADITWGADVAMNADGQGVAIWAERGSRSGYVVADVFARRYRVTSGWDPEPPRLYAGNYSGNLSVDEDRFGTVGIAWSQSVTSNNYQAMFSTQTVGGSWSTSQMEVDDLAPDYTSTDIEPQVRTALDSGDVLMAWRKRVEGSTFAPHFRWRSNGAWGVESEVGKIDHLYAAEIRTGVADDGRAVAAWTYYHCYYDSNYPDRCADAPLTSLPASTTAAISNVFVAVYK